MRVYRGAFGIIMAQGIVPNSFEVLKYLFLKLANKYAYFLPKSESHHACKRHLSKKNVRVFLKATTFSKIGPTGCLILLDKFCPKVAYFKRGHFWSFSGKWLPIFRPKSVGMLKLTVAYKKTL